MAAKKRPPYDPKERQQVNRDLVLRALTDRKFRKQLADDPKAALGGEVTDIHRREISLVLAAVKGIESQIRAVGDELLCVEGPPCGIA